MGLQHMHEAGGVSEPSGRQLDLEEAFKNFYSGDFYRGLSLV